MKTHPRPKGTRCRHIFVIFTSRKSGRSRRKKCFRGVEFYVLLFRETVSGAATNEVLRLFDKFSTCTGYKHSRNFSSWASCLKYGIMSSLAQTTGTALRLIASVINDCVLSGKRNMWQTTSSLNSLLKSCYTAMFLVPGPWNGLFGCGDSVTAALTELSANQKIKVGEGRSPEVHHIRSWEFGLLLNKCAPTGNQDRNKSIRGFLCSVGQEGAPNLVEPRLRYSRRILISSGRLR